MRVEIVMVVDSLSHDAQSTLIGQGVAIQGDLVKKIGVVTR